MVAILSGNLNFRGRVHPKLDLGYLASPPLVVAYAVEGDILRDPVGRDPAGAPVHLSDLWPCEAEIAETMREGWRRADVTGCRSSIPARA